MDVIRQRMLNERLLGAKFSRPADMVKWFGAVQAQDPTAAKWGVGQRVKDCTDADVEKAFSSGKFLRTHVMRPTWHYVMPEDIVWMQLLTGPRVKSLMAHYDRKLGIPESLYKRSSPVIYKLLKGGQHKTRQELSHALHAVGIKTTNQTLAHIVMRAELDALICSGAMRGKKHTYALVEERAPKAKELTRDEALQELATRYFTSHGPALPHDFAWWSGLTVGDARKGIELAKHDLLHETIGSKAYWFAESSPAPAMKNATIHLLPNYDEYFIGYRDRSHIQHELHKILVPQAVFWRHIIFLNGKVAGGWRDERKSKSVSVVTKLVVNLNEAQKKALNAEAQAFGKFIGLEAAVSELKR